MAVTPNTRIRLLKSPIELDNLNQLTFQNVEAQTNYFLSLPHIEIDNCTYQRKDDIIRFPAHIDSILEYNYVMYQNSNYSDKWFYAFIDDMTYYSDNTTYIKISTDCFQTWQFDIDVKRSFVVREHTNNDTVGANTVPECLETGTMIATNCTPITYLRDLVDSGSDIPENYVIVVGATIELDNTGYSKNYGSMIQGLYSGVTYYCFPTGEDVNIMLSAINAGSSTNIEDIVSIFMAPKSLCIYIPPSGSGGEGYDEVNTSYGKYYVHKITTLGADSFRTIDYYVDKPTSLDGYTPVNKKLLTGEFNSMFVTNYCGVSQNYRYEFFNGNRANFHMRGVIAPGCPIIMYPVNYLRNTDAQYAAGSYAISAPRLPVCNWNSDQYINWLASTTHSRTANIATNIGKSVVGIGLVGAGLIGSLYTGGASMGAVPLGVSMLGSTGATIMGTGMAMSGATGILNEASQLADHEKDANANNGDTNAADTNYMSSKVFGAYQYCIKNEYARKIDRILSVTGYKTLEMKVPNITGRRNWNYVQTQSVAIQAAIPQEDLQVIKRMFDNGVTFWHNPATFLDYSQNNDII